MGNFALRRAHVDDVGRVWSILQGAVAQLRMDGKDQWQNSYPSLPIVQADVAAGHGYVLERSGVVVAYAAIRFGRDAKYEAIEGHWLTAGPYAVVHRLARDRALRGRRVGLRFLQSTEDLCVRRDVLSVRLDTDWDNEAMQKTLARLGYIHCGRVPSGNTMRPAYEKILQLADAPATVWDPSK